jgi:hypothetical protein
MQTSACFESSNDRAVQVDAGRSKSLRLRENAREGLEQLATAASDVMRRAPGVSPALGPALSMARARIEAYCDHLGEELEPHVAQTAGFGGLLSGHLRAFRARQLRELSRIEALVQVAPRSAGVAHGVHVAALVLLADLDGHVRDLELISGSAQGVAA